MHMIIYRKYYNDGTNGRLFINESANPFCHTIELPWRNNEHNHSCIPEGTYLVKKRYSEKFNWHLQVMDVHGRGLILFHPANDAISELQGCIAPVAELTGSGTGRCSRLAFYRLMDQVSKAVAAQETIYLTIGTFSTSAGKIKQ